MIKLLRKRRPLYAVAIALAILVNAAVSGEELPIAERPTLDLSLQLESKSAVGRAVSFLRRRQRENGSWHQSPILTSLALAALAQSPEAETDEVEQSIRHALNYLQAADPPKSEPESESLPDKPMSDEANQAEEDATQEDTNGLTRQAETVLRIMTAVSGEQNSRLSDLAARALPAGHPPAALETAVVTAVRLRECLAPDTKSPANLKSALQWACTYYTGPARQALDKHDCRTFIYVLGQALQAVRAELPGYAENGDNWRRQAALELLNRQGGSGQWTCEDRQGDTETDADHPATNTAATAFALLLFGQVLNP